MHSLAKGPRPLAEGPSGTDDFRAVVLPSRRHVLANALQKIAVKVPAFNSDAEEKHKEVNAHSVQSLGLELDLPPPIEGPAMVVGLLPRIGVAIKLAHEPIGVGVLRNLGMTREVALLEDQMVQDASNDDRVF